MKSLRERLALFIAPWLNQPGSASWVIFDHPAQTIYTTTNTATTSPHSITWRQTS